MALKGAILVLVVPTIIFGQFSQNEETALFSFIKATDIKHIIIICDFSKTYQPTLTSLKRISEEKLPTTIVSVQQSSKLINHLNFAVYSKTVVVFHDDVADLILNEYFHSQTIAKKISNFFARESAIVSDLNWIWVTANNDRHMHFKHYIPYDCKFAVFKLRNETGYDIEEWYMVKNYTNLITQSLGFWNTSNGLACCRETYLEKFDLRQTQLVILQTYSDKAPKQAIVSAYERMIKHMSRMMNFTVEFSSYIDMNMTYPLNADVVVGPVVLGEVFDAVGPIWKTPAFLHIRYDPKYLQGVDKPHVRPFERTLWIFLYSWTVVAALSMIFVEYFVNRRKCTKLTVVQQFVSSWLRPYEALANQCGTDIPCSLSTRVGTLSMRLLILVANPTYSAAIVSFITVKVLQLPFMDLEGLVEDGTFRILYQNLTHIGPFFATTTEPAAKLAYQQYVDFDNRTNNILWVLQTLCRQRNVAFVYFNNDLFRFPEQCLLLQIPRPVFTAWDAFFLQNGSPLRKVFNKILDTYRSSGTLRKMGEAVYGRPMMIASAPDELPQVELRSIKAPFFILFLGITLSATFFIIEHLIYKSRQRRVDRERRVNAFEFIALAPLCNISSSPLSPKWKNQVQIFTKENAEFI